MVMIAQGHRKEFSEGFRLTTNNRMELLAVIKALEAMKRKDVVIELYTDSKYVCDAIEKKWVFGWQKKGFKGKANPDLWARFLELYPHFKIRFHWLKGHAGHPENERCDELATMAADGNGLKQDAGYENAIKNG